MSFGEVKLIVIGSSAGGIEALREILSPLKSPWTPPIAVVQHRAEQGPELMVSFFKSICSLEVKEGESTEPLQNGHIYFAPAAYHMLIGPQMTLDLNVDEPVLFSRPSVDVLFESAAEAVGAGVLGILLTGANEDGAAGLRRIVEKGGHAIIQDPAEALFKEMPLAALRILPSVDKFSLREIKSFLMELGPAR